MRKTKLRRVSKKRQEELAIYAKKRAEIMPGTICEYPECWKPANEVHHRNGRRGKMLNERKHWILLCIEHHRWVHDHGRDARLMGLLK